MSFRELRNFTEMMRALGYHGLISVENFRVPNFDLVADILYWLVKRYEPLCDIGKSWGNEHERVHFLKSCAQLMVAKGRIKLNIKRLYQADGYAVKELLKISTVLYQSLKAPADEDDISPGMDNMTVRLADLKGVREVASEITTRGATLSDLLSKEEELRDARERAVSRNLVMKDVEKTIRDSIAQVETDIRQLEEMIVSSDADKVNLDSKIEKKKADLERVEKRLRSLQSARPAFMDEYEKLEVDLQELFRVYLERFRNLDYLEHELDSHFRAEQDRMEESDRAMKRMQKRLREEELRILRGEQEVDEAALDDDLFNRASPDDDGLEDRSKRRGGKGRMDKPAGVGADGGGKGRKPDSGAVVGSLDADDSDESDSEVSDVDVSEEESGTPISMDSSGNTDDLIANDDGSEGVSLSDEDPSSSDGDNPSDNDF